VQRHLNTTRSEIKCSCLAPRLGPITLGGKPPPLIAPLGVSAGTASLSILKAYQLRLAKKRCYFFEAIRTCIQLLDLVDPAMKVPSPRIHRGSHLVSSFLWHGRNSLSFRCELFPPRSTIAKVVHRLTSFLRPCPSHTRRLVSIQHAYLQPL
jgi:hypothetical protein